MSDTYRLFIERKSHLTWGDGFAPRGLPPTLFGFQSELVDWACRLGRAAIFADCGLGKTPMQLAWAEQVVRETDGRVLILTPLAVSFQTMREAAKFGVEAVHSKDGRPSGRIVVTNYESLHRFDPADFVGAVCDESSILKAMDGVRRAEITRFVSKMRYRLQCTATPAPNDFVELGTASEALGNLGYTDMLGRFFVADDGRGAAARRGWGSSVKFRLKGHAEEPFWRWVASWARCVRKPSDLGDYSDDDFVLPPLVEREHIVEVQTTRDGELLDLPAIGLREQREEQRRTIVERCETAASLVNGEVAIAWCHLNDEGDTLERMIPGAVQVSGDDEDNDKERKFLSFVDGSSRVLVTKPKIGAWGLNFQHCAHVLTFPSHSFESYYQSVRRCWRFGQTRQVDVDIIGTEGSRAVMANLRRKATQADEMFDRLVGLINRGRAITASAPTMNGEVPSWM